MMGAYTRKDKSNIKKDLDNDSVAEKIKTDKSLGVKDGVSATPTILVNGKSIAISGTRASLKKAITDEIDDNL